MKTNQTIAAWKNADAIATTDSPAHDVQIQETMMGQVIGGANSAGLVCSVSGECNVSGKSCWTHLADFFTGNF
jgi:hypothetical protein